MTVLLYRSGTVVFYDGFSLSYETFRVILLIIYRHYEFV